jgi:predicted RNA-binding Zn-ribbon protein involved in translation (DUF1610 family)
MERVYCAACYDWIGTQEELAEKKGCPKCGEALKLRRIMPGMKDEIPERPRW